MDAGQVVTAIAAIGALAGTVLTYLNGRRGIDNQQEKSFREDVLKRLQAKEERETTLTRQVLELTTQVAELKGHVVMYQMCPKGAGCPFRSPEAAPVVLTP